MVQLLKIKELICQFVGRFEIYVMALIRFVIAFTAFTLINQHVGYMAVLKEYPVPLVFALLCSFLPGGMMLFLGAAMILAHFYALSLELCALTCLLFLILFFLYFRFSSGKGLYTVLTPVLGTIGVPYVMPVSAGLMSQPYTGISVVCGTVIFFLLRNVEKNAALFTVDEGTTRSIVTLAVTQIFGDKEMYLYLIAFSVATIAVYCIRKLSTDHSRTIALLLGVVVQLGFICAGEIYLKNTKAIVTVIIGCVISALILMVVDFMTMSLDYSRVEHVQFEDDEYYYYVKAVPKAFVSAEDKQVKKINAKKTKKRKPAMGKKIKAVHMSEEHSRKSDSLESQVMQEFSEDKNKK